MRAAVIRTLGQAPELADVPEPELRDGDVLLRVRAATINPVDLSISRGGFWLGDPEVPYVAGSEGVGELDDRLAYFEVRGGFDGRGGTLAERAAAPRSQTIVLPHGADPALAVGFGIAGLAAWLGLEWTGRIERGETVLVLGASGAVGQVAVQAAKLMGAGRVVAAGRSEDGLARARELGADATVRLAGDDPSAPLAGAELTERFKEAAGGEVDLVFDPLWGPPALAAFTAMATHGRLVQIGQSAGASVDLASAIVRGRARRILGHTNFAVPWADRESAFLRMVEHSIAGELTVDHETMGLEQAPEAWRRQAASPGRKLVLVP